MSEEFQEIDQSIAPGEIVDQQDEHQEEHKEDRQHEPRLFTEADVNAIIKKRLVRFEKQLRQQSAPPQQQVVIDAPPSRDQFATDEQWLDARDAYRDRIRDEEQTRQTIDREGAKLYKKAEKLEGFDRDSFDSLPLSQIMAQSIMDSDVAPELMAFLSQNPDEVDRISELKPARQAAELGKLELKLASKTPMSRTPPPIQTVGGRVSQNSVISDKTSQGDFEKFLRQQGII